MRTTACFLPLLALSLAACSPDPQTQARIDELQKNPEISVVGEFDGCTVKFVNRYYRDSSFYLARCGDTTATTRQYSERSGKSSIPRTSLEITQEIAKLQQEAKEAAAREKALSKLTPEERQALGVSKD